MIFIAGEERIHHIRQSLVVLEQGYDVDNCDFVDLIRVLNVYVGAINQPHQRFDARIIYFNPNIRQSIKY